MRKFVLGLLGCLLLLGAVATSFALGSTDTYAAAPKKLSHAAALKLVKAAGISVVSSGNCSNRYNKRCTSLEQINRTTVDGIIAFKKKSRCAVSISGGTEVGHATSTYSHWNGYKVDIQHTSCVTTAIHHFKRIANRGDGAPQYVNGKNTYADEGNHWDITYR